MDNVVYILGAGFSAPLGLPVMSNFIFKSKDMYFDEPEEYDYFKKVFDLIEEMSFIKNYYDADLFNIEEILSILEMKNFLEENKEKELFINYIEDVVSYYTPDITPRDLPSNFYDFIMGAKKSKHNLYGNFIVNILNLVFKKENGELTYYINEDREYNYSVITLNYDMVIENYINFLSNKYNSEDEFQIVKSVKEHDFTPNKFALCKLHGCIEKGNIVPPTWNKDSDNNLLDTWKLANKLLKNANHIRIIGYSLPITDSYMTYLFKSSILDSKHLKSIDVITLDDKEEIKSNYDNFIDFDYYQFKNEDVLEYFKAIKKEFKDGSSSLINKTRYTYDVLESAHKKFME